ncbi:MAG: carbamate kinase, partial [Treponema sp.]|nr:carbamate kinase [Treponema sp.]
AFSNPTKPVGKFYEKNVADEIALQKGYTFVEDAGRGYRRVVASPFPIAIVESKIIEQILKSGNIVIAVGGGGVPVIKSNNVLKGVDAVIDKDLANAKLALELNADLLLILTAVEKVAINFNKPNEQFLSHLTVDECKKYIADGHFAKGSMLPKVEACVQFVSESNNFSRDTSYSKKAVITSLSKAEDALHGKTGTLITAS